MRWLEPIATRQFAMRVPWPSLTTLSAVIAAHTQASMCWRRVQPSGRVGVRPLRPPPPRHKECESFPIHFGNIGQLNHVEPWLGTVKARNSNPSHRKHLQRKGLESGGAGNRTPVREKIDHSVYVRISLISVAERWPMRSPRPTNSPKISPAAGRRNGRLSRYCDTQGAAPGGLLYEQGFSKWYYYLRSQGQV